MQRQLLGVSSNSAGTLEVDLEAAKKTLRVLVFTVLETAAKTAVETVLDELDNFDAQTALLSARKNLVTAEAFATAFEKGKVTGRRSDPEDEQMFSLANAMGQLDFQTICRTEQQKANSRSACTCSRICSGLTAPRSDISGSLPHSLRELQGFDEAVCAIKGLAPSPAFQRRLLYGDGSDNSRTKLSTFLPPAVKVSAAVILDEGFDGGDAEQATTLLPSSSSEQATSSGQVVRRVDSSHQVRSVTLSAHSATVSSSSPSTGVVGGAATAALFVFDPDHAKHKMQHLASRLLFAQLLHYSGTGASSGNERAAIRLNDVNDEAETDAKRQAGAASDDYALRTKSAFAPIRVASSKSKTKAEDLSSAASFFRSLPLSYRPLARAIGGKALTEAVEAAASPLQLELASEEAEDGQFVNNPRFLVSEDPHSSRRARTSKVMMMSTPTAVPDAFGAANTATSKLRRGVSAKTTGLNAGRGNANTSAGSSRALFTGGKVRSKNGRAGGGGVGGGPVLRRGSVADAVAASALITNPLAAASTPTTL